jgi:glycosyltransferase involved in cell wall biosynthesis
MDMEKGIRELLEAFKRLKAWNKNLFLCFVGGLKREIQEYEGLVRQEGLERDVMFVGQRPPYEIPLYLRAFDVCVMPFPWTRHYAYFMSPLKLFEYMAARRPIVASDLPSVREILNEGNAVLVEPGNPKALAEGIENVLENEELANKIAKKAYEDVRAHSWERRAARILDFIRGGRSL